MGKKLPGEELAKYHLNRDSFHEFMVLPRLLFGEYLNSQFKLLFEQAKKLEIITTVHLNSKVVDINDLPSSNCVKIKTAGGNTFEFSHVVISTGHTWQATHEGRIPGYFDSLYPPSKLKLAIDHPIAIRGSSLTAIDAIRTLARNNGKFVEEESHKLSYQLNKHAENFKMVMHFRQGLLPGVRFHLED